MKGNKVVVFWGHFLTLRFVVFVCVCFRKQQQQNIIILSESKALSKHGCYLSSEEKERQVLQICVLFFRVLLKPLTDSSVCAMANVHLAAATSLLLHLKNEHSRQLCSETVCLTFPQPQHSVTKQLSFVVSTAATLGYKAASRLSFPWPQHLVTKLLLVCRFHRTNTWLQSCLSFVVSMAATFGYKAASRLSFPWP